MSFVCLWIPGAWTDAAPPSELSAALLEVAPRVVVEARGVVWADARGLAGVRVAELLLQRVGAGAGAGVSAVPIVAEAAAKAGGGEGGGEGEGEGEGNGGGSGGGNGGVMVVEEGRERDFLAPLGLCVLSGDERLLELLEGVGVRTCGQLAELEGEAVEVRFGAEGTSLWRLARAQDPRRIFGPAGRERPHASVDFVDYVLTDPARLVFAANALLGSVADALRSRGEHARRMTLSLRLANGEARGRRLRPARPTASRETWLRLIRATLERLSVPDAVAGLALEVEATEPAAAIQGDLFDRGFASASAVEAAIARLLEAHGPIVVEPERSEHPLAERRVRWVSAPVDPPLPPPAPAFPSPFPALGFSGAKGVGGQGREAGNGGGKGKETGDGNGSGEEARIVPALSLQLLPTPRPVTVETVSRRDHEVPVCYHDGEAWQRLVTSAGPDRISGGRWEGEPYAREYFRCVTAAGVLIWLFREARTQAWYLHGWWD